MRLAHEEDPTEVEELFEFPRGALLDFGRGPMTISEGGGLDSADAFAV